MDRGRNGNPGSSITSSHPQLGQWGGHSSVPVISVAWVEASFVHPTAALSITVPSMSPRLSLHILYELDRWIRKILSESPGHNCQPCHVYFYPYCKYSFDLAEAFPCKEFGARQLSGVKRPEVLEEVTSSH